jgi:hypothetical protein
MPFGNLLNHPKLELPGTAVTAVQLIYRKNQKIGFLNQCLMKQKRRKILQGVGRKTNNLKIVAEQNL